MLWAEVQMRQTPQTAALIIFQKKLLTEDNTLVSRLISVQFTNDTVSHYKSFPIKLKNESRSNAAFFIREFILNKNRFYTFAPRATARFFV
jgi:hypothetical protein